METKNKCVLYLEEKDLKLKNVLPSIEAIAAHGEVFHIFN
jgi:hypothetical protein